jgi:hypothetical protein
LLSDCSVKDLLFLVRGKILQLPEKQCFKRILLEDIELAINCFNKDQIQCVINSLTVISEKIHTRETTNTCLSQFNPLLADLHQLQQMVINLPISSLTGPRGATGPQGPRGAIGATGPSGIDRHLSCETDSILTCGQYIPGNTQPIATDQEGNVVNTPTATKHSQLGQLFGLNIETTGVSTLQPLWVQITNPANSGKVLHIERIVGGINTGSCEINLYQNAPPLNNSNPIFSITRRNWGSTNNSIVTATVSGDSGPIFVGLLQNTFHTAGYFELEFNGELIIPSSNTNQTFSIQIINTSGMGIVVDFAVIWSETP